MATGMTESKVVWPRMIPDELLPPGVRFTKIFCGAMITLALSDKGELYGCGINDLGQLGLDTYVEEMALSGIDKARNAARM
jgi:alpha-tubulin suppressor-like RCC1 family protein